MVVYFGLHITCMLPGSEPWGGIGPYEGYLKGLVPHSTIPPKIYGIWYPDSGVRKQGAIWYWYYYHTWDDSWMIAPIPHNKSSNKKQETTSN